MSKFFGSSSDSSDSEDSDNVVIQRTVDKPKKTFEFLSDSDEEGPRRVVLAAKDKVYKELKDHIRQCRNAEKINDFPKLLNLFEDLTKAYKKAQSIMNREGLTTPRFYIRYIVELEDYTNRQWEEKDSKNKTNQKNLNSLRQRVRRYCREFEKDVAAYREGPDPVGYTSNEEEEVVGDKPTPARAAMKADSSDSEFGSESSSSEDDDIDLEGIAKEELRKYFLKSTKEKTTGKKKERRDRQKAEAVESDDDEGEWNLVQVVGEKPLFPHKAEITLEQFLKKYNEVTAVRGKKSTNPKQFLKQLDELYDVSKEKDFGSGILVKIRLALISALFDVDSKLSSSMDYGAWCKTLETVNLLFNLLEENKNVIVSIKVSDEQENFSDENKPYKIHGSLVFIVKRLDDELTKIFQHADCHSTDYLEKLKGERELCLLIEKAQAYVDSHHGDDVFDATEVALIYTIRIEHLYYKFSSNEKESEELMDILCKKIYSLQNVKQYRQRALLCQIYHHAMHDRWYKAKDLLLMSHLQAIVDHSDAATQILYNRTICQLGLCAFRHGFIREAHQGLSEIQNTQRTKEFLAQGVPPRQIEKTSEQEAKERAMQVPYHMHINLELLECVYLICSMLLEIPNIACHEYDIRRRLLSRSFHYQLKMSERSPLIGPPENTREHVVAASRAMLKGDWKKCKDYIVNEKMNAKVWNLFRNSDKVKQMVVQRIQEESLRTYLLMYSTVYFTVSLDNLCESFELDKQRVYSIISKMIIQEELSATLDEPTNCLIMHRNEPSRLQIATLTLTDKLSQLTENNEQFIEPRIPGRGYTGTGNWNVQRRTGDDRTGDDKNRQRGAFQVDRRTGKELYVQDNKRNAWNANNQNRRRDVKVRF